MQQFNKTDFAIQQVKQPSENQAITLLSFTIKSHGPQRSALSEVACVESTCTVALCIPVCAYM